MSVNFTAANLFAVGAEPDSVAVADVTGDGILDLVVSTSKWSDETYDKTYGLATLPGQGNGQFGSAIASSGDEFGSIRAIAIGDFNNDANLDVMTTNAFSDSGADVVLALGDGSGGFTSSATLFVGNRPETVTIGDINGDGNLDAITGNSTNSTTTILLGDGSGGFQSSNSLTLGGSPEAIALEDFDGDGQLDLATVVETNGKLEFVVLQGNGAGAFTLSTTIALNNAPTYYYYYGDSDLAIADFNDDGQLDVAVLADDTVSVLLGNGSTNQFKRVFQSQQEADSITAEDMNGDGRVDLVASLDSYSVGTANDVIGVMLGDGNGHFSQPELFPTNGYAPAIATRDFNRDGKPDLVSVDGSVESAFVFLNTTTTTDAITQGTKGYSGVGYIDASSELGSSITVDLSKSKFILNDSSSTTPTSTPSLVGVVDIIGTAQDDVIRGNNADNHLTGGSGADELIGGKGGDRLLGGAGNDELTGNNGKDRFIFSATPNYPDGVDSPFHKKQLGVDRILDFKPKQDKMILDPDTFTQLTVRQRVSFEVVDKLSDARSSQGIITYVQDKGKLFYNANGSDPGFGGGGLFAILDNEADLSAKSFAVR
ncbi:MAG: FG-GAP-like repeat-containing protein [Leptolyngbyaceae cyanobacterium]